MVTQQSKTPAEGTDDEEMETGSLLPGAISEEAGGLGMVLWHLAQSSPEMRSIPGHASDRLQEPEMRSILGHAFGIKRKSPQNNNYEPE